MKTSERNKGCSMCSDREKLAKSLRWMVHAATRCKRRNQRV